MPSRICRSFGDSDRALQSGICLVAYFVVKCVHKILDWIQEKEIQRFGYELSDYEFGKTKEEMFYMEHLECNHMQMRVSLDAEGIK